MIMNYNEWFNKYHRYLFGSRDGVQTYNDTKWNTVKERYQTLIDLNSQLIDQQPFGVAGNYTGFQELLELMQKSNYAFEDLDYSLIQTYQMSLQNAMSKMLVNTHVVVASVKYGDTKNISMDKYGNYIVDVPYDQLHFGDRDEFIRQHLHKMYETENQYYIPATEFFTEEISSVLGFTLMCCVNGYLTNGWAVGVDEKGFRFQIPWKQTADPNFIIYKLDSSTVVNAKEIPINIITSNTPISADRFDCSDMKQWIGSHCIVEICDAYRTSNSIMVPNFGVITEQGLEIKNIQQRTLNDLEYQGVTNVSVRVYILKYFHEIRNVYPAFNYYDMMGSAVVYDDHGDHIVNEEGNRVLLQQTTVSGNDGICTPPISIDHPSTSTYETLINTCFMVRQLENEIYPKVAAIGKGFNNQTNPNDIRLKIIRPATEVLTSLKNAFAVYMKTAILTTMISQDKIHHFESMIEKFQKLSLSPATVSGVQARAFEELYGDNFMTMFVKDIASPIKKEPFVTLSTIANYTPNYFPDDISDGKVRFNRPMAEQCFITMQYSRDEQCWLFAAPTIRHMKGIGNTFYISDSLKGYELFKFFFLYTDTDNPGETVTDELSYEQTIDFDLFTTEVKRHFGYVRYWGIESRLTKLSQMLYQDSNNDTKINVISKILKRKLDDPTFMEYPSDMNFELSNITSDNLHAGEYDFRAPFALNFLFYTVSMLYGNKDQLLAYFIQTLTDRKFHPRYSDLKVSDIPHEDAPMISVNYARVMHGPTEMTSAIRDNSVLSTDANVKLYAGVPFVLDANNDALSGIAPYTYIFEQNLYDLPLLTSYGVDMEYSFTDPSTHTMSSGYDDGKIASMISVFVSEVMTQMTDILAYYKSDWNQENRMRAVRNLTMLHKNKILQYIEDRGADFNPFYQETTDIIAVIESLTEDSFMPLVMLEASEHMHIYSPIPGKPAISLHNVISTVLMMMQKVFDLTGFDHDATRRLRRLYLQMKQLEQPMGLKEFHDWAETFDLHAYHELPNSYSDNPNVMYYASKFENYEANIRYFIYRIIANSETLMELYQTGSFGGINSFDVFCDYLNFIKDNVFDLYTMNQITITPEGYNSEPAYATITFNRQDPHVCLPTTEPASENCVILLHPMYESVDDGYVMNRLVPVCFYAFFDGTDVTANINVYSKANSLITTISNVPISFSKVSRWIDGLPNTMQYVSSYVLPLNVLNVHETFDVSANGDVINKQHALMNYEMLAGNQFIPLQSFAEYQTRQQGPYDRIYIPCESLNHFATVDRKHQDVAMWFKPCWIQHPPTVDETTYNAYGGKYHRKQIVYAATVDGLCVFPMKVRAVTHAENKGFIEAVVDEYNAKWFRTTDKTVMEQYLTEAIPCRIVDDNVRNFMDEFSVAESIPENLSGMFERKAHLIYIGATQLETDDRNVVVTMINHNFNPYSVEELYPVLRTEPDDHSIWDEERKVFNAKIAEAMQRGTGLAVELRNLAMQYSYATTREERIQIQIQMDNVRAEMDYQEAFVKRLRYYLEQLEMPTTWYNVYAYDDALVYINNGRAHLSRTYQPSIRDLSYTDDVQVRLYDWEAKRWIDQSAYTVTATVAETDIDESSDVKTNADVMTSLTITFASLDYTSRKILVYFMYQDSDAFDSIPVNDQVSFDVMFKPVFSSTTFAAGSDDPYEMIRIRKHYDANEKYPIKILDPAPDDFGGGYLVKRVDRNGTYTNSSTLRICNLTVKDASEYDVSNFDIYVKHPFPKTTVPQEVETKSYQTTVVQVPDGFEAGHDITLVCVENGHDKFFNGALSSIMFHAVTSDTNVITVDSDTLPIHTPSGRYVCTVLPATSHPLTGGVVVVNVTTTMHTLSSPSNDWIKLPDAAWYHIIPDEFVLVPKSGVTLTQNAVIILQNQYELDTAYDVSADNHNVNDPFTIYYDTAQNVRYPVGNIRKQNSDERLVINRSTNPTVDTIKTNYIGISRYVAQDIPKDGIIDLTGRIPTPLNRERYEFWVNGRYVSDPNQLIILSPTTFQLRNMTSLRNLEVIELVDDTQDSLVLPKGTVYVDLNGKMYSNYKLAVFNNANIVDQSIAYQFGANTRTDMDVYLPDVNRNANNIDLEPDIMTYITIPDPTSYDELNALPSINGEKIYHETSSSIGFKEIPAVEILKQFDRTWKRERFDGVVSMIHTTNRVTLDQQTQDIHVVATDDGYLVYTSGINTFAFTMYISDLENGEIDDTEHTLKIIPMIQSGVTVKLDASYQGNWLHSTIKNTRPIQIQ